MASDFDLNCFNDDVDAIIDLYFQCETEQGCPGSRQCYNDVSWLDKLEPLFACFQEPTGVNLADRIRNEGICLCSTWYGLQGDDCTGYSRRSFFIFASQMLFLLISFIGFFWNIQMFRKAKEKRQQLATHTGRNNVYGFDLMSLAASSIGCLSIFLLKLFEMVVLLNPMHMTRDFEYIAPIVETTNEWKMSPVEIVVFPMFMTIASIAAVCSAALIVLSWIQLTSLLPMPDIKVLRLQIFRNMLIAFNVLWVIVACVTAFFDRAIFAFCLTFFDLILVVFCIYGFKRLGSILQDTADTKLRQIFNDDEIVPKRKLTDVWVIGAVPPEVSTENILQTPVADKRKTPIGLGKKRPSGLSAVSDARTLGRPRSLSIYDQRRLNDTEEYLFLQRNIRSTTLLVIFGSFLGIGLGLGFAALTVQEPWQEYSEPGKISGPMILYELLPLSLIFQIFATTSLYTRTELRTLYKRKSKNIEGSKSRSFEPHGNIADLNKLNETEETIEIKKSIPKLTTVDRAQSSGNRYRNGSTDSTLTRKKSRIPNRGNQEGAKVFSKYNKEAKLHQEIKKRYRDKTRTRSEDSANISKRQSRSTEDGRVFVDTFDGNSELSNDEERQISVNLRDNTVENMDIFENLEFKSGAPKFQKHYSTIVEEKVDF